MKIEKIETRKLEMPYTKPLVTATNNFTVARGLLVTVGTDGGVEGYGYSDLFPRAGETPRDGAACHRDGVESQGDGQGVGRSGAHSRRYGSCSDRPSAGEVGFGRRRCTTPWRAAIICRCR